MQSDAKSESNHCIGLVAFALPDGNAKEGGEKMAKKPFIQVVPQLFEEVYQAGTEHDDNLVQFGAIPIDSEVQH